jgi:hypothetical protein
MPRCQRPYLFAGLLLSCVATAPATAQECADVATSTLAEIRAGANTPLTDEVAALVRRAAGSACVKALSGRYSAELSSASAADPALTVAGPDEDSAAATGANPEAETASEKEESSLWPFDSLKINDVSASPSKKPYQRKR